MQQQQPPSCKAKHRCQMFWELLNTQCTFLILSSYFLCHTFSMVCVDLCDVSHLLASFRGIFEYYNSSKEAKHLKHKGSMAKVFVCQRWHWPFRMCFSDFLCVRACVRCENGVFLLFLFSSNVLCLFIFFLFRFYFCLYHSQRLLWFFTRNISHLIWCTLLSFQHVLLSMSMIIMCFSVCIWLPYFSPTR